MVQMIRVGFQHAGASFVLLLACALAFPAEAADRPKKPKAEKAARSQANQPGKVSFAEAPSHENAAARAKRLQRECRGRPNAGACMGHTR
jgi:hypothetical protein